MPFRRVPFQRWPLWRHGTLAGLVLGAVVIGGWRILQDALEDSALIVRQTVDLQAKLASLPGPTATAPSLLDSLPSPIKSAALLMVAGLYENREDVSDRQLYRNDTYYRLLAPYRAMSL